MGAVHHDHREKNCRHGLAEHHAQRHAKRRLLVIDAQVVPASGKHGAKRGGRRRGDEGGCHGRKAGGYQLAESDATRGTGEEELRRQKHHHDQSRHQNGQPRLEQCAKGARPRLRDAHHHNEHRKQTAKLLHQELNQHVELVEGLAHPLGEVSQRKHRDAHDHRKHDDLQRIALNERLEQVGWEEPQHDTGDAENRVGQQGDLVTT